MVMGILHRSSFPRSLFLVPITIFLLSEDALARMLRFLCRGLEANGIFVQKRPML